MSTFERNTAGPINSNALPGEHHPIERKPGIVLFHERLSGEREKSIEKYGDLATLSIGAPDREVFDYAANEIVGLVRYAEMISARSKVIAQNNEQHRQLSYRGQMLAQQIDAFAYDVGPKLLALRQQLDDLGLLHGEPERR